MAPPNYLKLLKAIAFFFIFTSSFWTTKAQAACGSGLSISSLTSSVASAAPGQSFTVTVVYQQTAGWNQVYFLGGFNLNQNTFQSCNTANQVFNIYPGFAGNGNSPGPPAGSGYGPISPGGTGPATQVFTVTVPPSLSAGSTYNYIIGVSGCDAQCGDLGNMEAEQSVSITIAPPAPSLTISKSAQGNTANVGDLVLFRVDYTYANTGPVTITDTLPSQVVPAAANGSEISPGGTITGQAVTWILPYSLAPQSGYVWVLTKVVSGTTGTQITNTASAAATGVSPQSASANVEIGGKFQLSKSESATSIAAGQTLTYTLSYSIGGTSLQTSDSYLNNTVGSSTTNGSNVSGYDGTGYTSSSNLDTWGIGNNATEGNYIDAQTPYGANSTSDYETLLRNTPPAPLCTNGTYLIEGDIDIPSLLQNATANGSGQDAAVILGVNTANSYGFVLVLSKDTTPAYFSLQENDLTHSYQTVASTNTFQSAAMSNVIEYDTWYTVLAQITNNGGTITINAVVWPVGTPQPPSGTWDISYTVPGGTNLCSGSPTYQYGWQVNPSANGGSSYSTGRELYSNLRMFGDDPAINTRIWDTVPTGMTYASQASGLVFSQTGSLLKWSFPATIYNQPTTSLTWWGTVSCSAGGAVTNTASVVDDTTLSGGGEPVTSNTVTAAVTGCSTPTNTDTNTPTNTPTLTPTNTDTPTPTNSPTNTDTPTPTNTPTLTPTLTPTNTPTNTPTLTPTNTPTFINSPTPTDTPTNTDTTTVTNTPTNTDTPTPTNTPTNTFTNTDTPTVTNTFTNTDTPTVTNTPTNTDTPTPTLSPTNTFTPTDTNTPTNSPTLTATFTPTSTATNTDTPTATNTATDTPTPFVVVNISKSVSDQAPSAGETLSYGITLSVPDSPASGVTITDTVPAGLQFVAESPVSNPPGPVVASVIPLATPANGTLLVWTFTGPIPTGNYTLNYTAAIPNLAPAGEVLLNQAALTYPGNITPQIAQVASTVTGNYTVRVDVYNEAGEVIKTLLITQYSQPVENVTLANSNTLVSINDKIQIIYQGQVIGTWDGTDNSGQEVSNGQYYIKIDNIDRTGVVTSITQPAIVARHLAHLNVDIYNAAGEIIRHLDNVVADLITLSTGVTLSAGTLSPSYQGGGGPNSTLTVTLSNGITLNWNGRNDNGQIVSNGEYFLELSTNDGQGSDATIIRSINVYHQGLSVTGPVAVYPNPINPRVDGKIINFVAGGGPGYTVKVNLYTLAGELIQRQEGQAGSGQLTWDISNLTLSSGVYLAAVEVYDPLGAMQRQITRLLFVH